MKYHQHLNHHRRQRYLFKLRFFLGMFCFFVLLAGAVGYYILVNSQAPNNNATATSRQTNSYIASSNQQFSKPYFQIQTDKTWAEIPAESTANKFIFRSIRYKLVEHELIIYVNQIPPNLSATRVLPVTINSNAELIAGQVSDHCMKTAGGSRTDNPELTMNKTRFKCSADKTMYTVIVAEEGGGQVLNLKRPDGSTAQYAIYYTNLKADSDTSHIASVIDSFRTR